MAEIELNDVIYHINYFTSVACAFYEQAPPLFLCVMWLCHSGSSYLFRHALSSRVTAKPHMR